MKTADQLIKDIDAIVNDPRWKPYAGFDPPTGPTGALQQSRNEFHKFLGVLVEHELVGGPLGRCLQLGLGPSRGTSHAVWQHLFGSVVTIDENVCKVGNEDMPGVNTHDFEARRIATIMAPYDLVFIDAGHFYLDVNLDHQNYAHLCRPGGIVAFHDSCRRKDIPQHEIWKYLEDNHPDINNITDEGIGIAWYVK